MATSLDGTDTHILGPGISFCLQFSCSMFDMSRENIILWRLNYYHINVCPTRDESEESSQDHDIFINH